MNITRDMVVKKVSEKSGYFQKDVKVVFQAFDEVVLDCFNEVTDDEEITIQFTQGVRCGAKVVPARDRVDPRDGTPIVVSETVKPFTRFSDAFRQTLQEQYESKKNG